MSAMNEMIEYLKIHLISLQQDWDEALQGEGYEYLSGQIEATRHLLSVAEDILNK
jgi:hypothetical protein